MAARLLKRYRSDSGRTFYALTERGATFLREKAADDSAIGSAKHASDKRNPEHDLWAAFFTIACETLGFEAHCERELAQKLGGGIGTDRTWPVYTDSLNGKQKGQMPDALAVYDERKAAIWIEIDRSMRGSSRLYDLARLVERVGRPIDILDARPTLCRVIVACKSLRILRRNIAYVTATITPKSGSKYPRIRTGAGSYEPALRREADGLFAVARDIPDARHGLVAKPVGVLEFRLLPVWLLGLTYGDSAPRTEGWFDDEHSPLPFRGAQDLTR